MTRYFEDIAVGETHDCGTCRLSSEEITQYATEYGSLAGPLEFRVRNPDRARASGLLVCARTWRLVVEEVFQDLASLGAWGIDNLRWYHPVYANEPLRVDLEVLDKHAPARNQARGTVDVGVAVTKESSKRVLEYVDHALIAHR